MKKIHVKPAFYAYCYEQLKILAVGYGYNLVLHGSLGRDMDLILIPWEGSLGDQEKLIKAMAIELGGTVADQTDEEKKCFPHGRESRVININRKDGEQYYLDISIFPTNN